MNRRKFLRNASIGVGSLIVAPVALASTPEISFREAMNNIMLDELAIAHSFGIPPVKLNLSLKGRTFDNMDAANKRFYEKYYKS